LQELYQSSLLIKACPLKYSYKQKVLNQHFRFSPVIELSLARSHYYCCYCCYYYFYYKGKTVQASVESVIYLSFFVLP